MRFCQECHFEHAPVCPCFEQMPRTPRTGHARPRPRRSAPKSRFFEQNSHALTPR
nr:MAG TPA: hypothetical protein [Caudoviricetes sp.]